jgi:penicillin-binding protein 1C
VVNEKKGSAHKKVKILGLPKPAGKSSWFIGLLGSLLLLATLLVVCRFMLPGRLFEHPYSTVLLDREGRLLGAAISGDQQWRFPPLARVPAKFAQAIVCYEDRRFYYHPGVDPVAIVRALGTNIRAGRVVSGASTITMQVIRLSRGAGERCLDKKLIEAALALGLETKHSKKEILALYAAHAPFGGNVVGLEAAAWRYFGRKPDKLSWAEAAMLAVLPNNPALIHPGKNRRRLKTKRDLLLEKLFQNGALDRLSCDLAQSEDLPHKPHALPMLAPHLLARAKREAKAREKGFLQNSRIFSTLKKDIQTRAMEIVHRHHHVLRGNAIHNIAALIADVNSGEVLAYVGNHVDPLGKNDCYGAQVDVITAPRSTGSILKPFLYAAMMEAGELLPTQLVPDIPTRMGGFRPQNYTRTHQGAVPAKMALARSLNIPAVRMLQSYGVDRFYHDLKRLGLNTLFRPAHDYGLALILGGAEGTLWDIAGIYTAMARCLNHENRPQLAELSKAPLFRPLTYLDSRAVSNLDAPGGCEPLAEVLDPASCWLTIEAMLEVARPGDDGAWRSFSSARKIAWKTGTSYGFRDAWAVGITPGHVVGVWVGNAHGEGRPGLSGIACAGPVLFDLFGLLEDSGWFQRPRGGLEWATVCQKSGYRMGPNCAHGRPIWIHKAGLRTGSCPHCRIVHLDASRTYRVHSECEPVTRIETVKWFTLPPIMASFYRRHHATYRLIPEYRADCRVHVHGAGWSDLPLSLVNPSANGLIYVPLELDGQRGRTVFEAAHQRPEAIVYWHLDDRYLGATTQIHQLEIAPPPGDHTITLVDDHGALLERRFAVLQR